MATTTATEPIEVSVVIPCLNEEQTLARVIEKALGSFRKHGIRGEVVVSDNGSTDRSVAIAEGLGARVVHQDAKGYGSALRKGCEEARGRFVIMGDADDSYDFSEILPFVEKLREGWDLVMGTRLKGKILPGAMPFLNRHLGNPTLTGILNLFFRSGVSDAHCGLRAFTKAAYQRMRLRTTGMEFASEMVIRASQAGLRITEVPIVYHPDARNRPPHLRPWRDGWRHLRFMLLYSPRWLFLIPGLALMAFGLFLMLWLLSGPRHVMGVRLDIHTMVLGSLFAVVGYQIVTIGLFAKIFALTESFENEDSFFRRAFSWFNLERGLLAGAALFLVGLVINVRLFFRWAGVDFGDLPAGITLRPALLASTLMILGAQTFFSSFFFSILGIARR